jgi:heat shock protein HslJ
MSNNTGKSAGSALAVLILLLSHSCTAESGPGPKHLPPTFSEAANAQYRGIYSEPVRLDKGRYEGEPFVEGGAARPLIVLIDEFIERGDLDGDGIEEAAVLLMESSGGSGSFLYLAVLSRAGEGLESIGTFLLGDRVQVRSVHIEREEVILSLVQHGKKDPLCCPTYNARKVLAFVDGILAEVSSEVPGRISITDFSGAEWILEQIGNEAVPESPEITLTCKGGKVSGFGGCNEYFANINEESPGAISIGIIGRTKKGCRREIMDLEDRYLGILRGAVRYGFLAGKLMVTCSDGEKVETLLFTIAEL